MEDGGSRAVAAAATARKKKGNNKNDAKTSWREQPRHPVPFFDQIPGITGEVRERLEELDTKEPSFMIGKSLVMSDMNRGQARLLFSCKREAPQFTSLFTNTEMQFVLDKTDKTGGLLVTAFDRAGRRYDLICKYLDSNAGYRFITGWNKYVVSNGLGVDTLVELWWFRSRKLPNRYEQQLRQKGGKEIKVIVPVTLENGHPDGSFGLVLLHYPKDDLLELEQAAADEPPMAQETATGHMESKTTTTAEGTCAKSKTTIAEDKLADDGGDCAETEISREEVLSAAEGLLKLREIYGRVGRGGGGRGPEPEPES